MRYGDRTFKLCVVFFMGCVKHRSVPGANSTHAAHACFPSGAQQLKKKTNTNTHIRIYTSRQITHGHARLALPKNHPIDVPGIVVGGETRTASILCVGQSIVSPRANARLQRTHPTIHPPTHPPTHPPNQPRPRVPDYYRRPQQPEPAMRPNAIHPPICLHYTPQLSRYIYD